MIESGEATKYLTSMLKGFKLEAADAMSVVDKLTKVDMSAAASAGEIAESLRQFATTAQISGVNIDQAIAMATTIMDVSQRDASSVGAALKTMISRYGNVKAGAFNKLNLDSDSGGEGESLNDIEKVLKKIGISMRDTNLQFRDFDDVLEDLSEKWTTLDNVSKSAVATAMAGVRQRESFLVLMENMDKYHDLVKTSAEAEGTATKKYLSYQESLEASQKRLQAAWENLAQNADINKFLTNVTNAAAFLVKNLPDIIKMSVRLITLFNSWKMPKMFSVLGSQLGMKGLGDAVSYGKNAFKSVTGKNRTQTGLGFFNEKVDKYDPTRTLSKISGAISENVKALKENTAALTGKKATSGGSNISEDGRITTKDGKYYLGIDENGQTKWMSAKTGKATGRQVTDNQRKAFEEQQKILEDQERKRLRAQRNARASAAASAAIMGGITGYLTAPKTHTYKDAKGNRVTAENSEDANVATATTSTVLGTASGVASVFGPWGMLAGAILQVFNQFFTPLLGRWIDSDRDAMKERVKEAEQSLGVLNKIESSVNAIYDLSKKEVWTSDDYKKADEEISKVLDVLYSEEGSKTREIMEKYFSKITGRENIDLYTELDNFLKNSGNREQLGNILQNATLQAQQEAKLKSYEEEWQKLNNELSHREYSGMGLATGQAVGLVGGAGFGTAVAGAGWGTLAGALAGQVIGSLAADGVLNVNANVINNALHKKTGLSSYTDLSTAHFKDEQQWKNVQAFKEAGFNVKETTTVGGWFLRIFTGFLTHTKTTIDAAGMTLTEQKEALEKLSRTEGETGEMAKEQLKTLKNLIAQTEKIYKDMNKSNVQLAAFNTSIGDTPILNMTVQQLKNIGYTGIKKAIAEELNKQGLHGHTVYFGGEISSYASDLIDAYMKTNSELYGILTGSAYTLREIYSMKNEDQDRYLENFATALGITKDDLINNQDRYGGLYGKMTYGDIIASPSETYSKLSKIADLYEKIGTSSALSAESMSEILNSYPQLLRYLGQEKDMYSEIVDYIEAYSQLYAKQTYDAIMTTQGYLDSYRNDIEKIFVERFGQSEYEALIKQGFGNAKTVEEALTWAITTKNPLGEELISVMKELFTEVFSVRTKEALYNIYESTMAEYYDKQIDNLKAQEEALKDINKQRELELELMKAKIALEDAQKEKKRVWREGVGWVYEADQSAISKAQDQLKEAQNKKSISELELEITEMEALKKYLTDYKSTQQYEEQQKQLEQFIDSQNLSITASAQLAEAITKLYDYVEEVDIAKLFGQEIDVKQENENQATAKLQQLWSEYQAAYARYQENRTVENAAAVDTALKNYQSYFQNAVNNNVIDTSGYKTWNSQTNAYDYYQTDASQFGSQESLNAAENSAYLTTEFGHVVYDGGKNHKGTFYINETSDNLDDKTTNKLWKAMTKKDSKVTGWLLGSSGYVLSDSAATSAKGYDSLMEYVQAHPNMVLYDFQHKNWYVIRDGQLHGGHEYGHDSDGNDVPYYKTVYSVNEAHAFGTLRSQGGLARINEFGTEAIVTPGGTVTALPSATGIVPADITKNLWELGEIAPNIIQMMMGSGLSKFGRNNVLTNSIVNGDSLNINTVNMTVNADDSFNVDKFVNEMKTAVTLNKNNRH